MSPNIDPGVRASHLKEDLEALTVLGAALAWYGDLANARTSLEFALRQERGHLDAERWLAEHGVH